MKKQLTLWPFVADFDCKTKSVIGRYRPHLMIVIFVTQNNLRPAISDHLLGFYPDFFIVNNSFGNSDNFVFVFLLLLFD